MLSALLTHGRPSWPSPGRGQGAHFSQAPMQLSPPESSRLRGAVSCRSLSISLGLLLLPLPLPGIQAFFPGPEAGPPPGPGLPSPDPALQATKLLPYMTNLFNRLIVPELSQKKWQPAMSPLCCETEVNVVKQVKKQTSRTEKPGEGWPEGGGWRVGRRRNTFLPLCCPRCGGKQDTGNFCVSYSAPLKFQSTARLHAGSVNVSVVSGIRRSPWWEAGRRSETK